MIFTRADALAVLGITSELLTALVRNGDLIPSKMSHKTMWFTGKDILEFIANNKVKGDVEKISK